MEKWNKSKFLFFLPQYYGRYLRGKEGHLLWKKKWGIAYNMQPAREVFVENVMTRVHSLQKISDQETNTLLAPASSYQDRVYTRLLTVSHKQFILFYFKELLEKMLEHPFKLPQLSLPFSKQSMQTLIRKNKIGPRYLVFVPFTSTSLRNWPLERFVFLANKLAAQTALKIVVIGTCKRNVRRTWADFPNIIDLVNKTSLLEAMQIAAGATYAVCSDTSLMHCALIGGAHTICLSCGRAKDLFVNYPVESGVKQQVFFPSVRDTQGIGY
ncbi:MAG: hypothetical protein MJ053_03365, partial [Elusimicrobiaceae bacterium]|nr:hypothetical protein [Elusimicrobiaceae bacterium]